MPYASASAHFALRIASAVRHFASVVPHSVAVPPHPVVAERRIDAAALQNVGQAVHYGEQFERLGHFVGSVVGSTGAGSGSDGDHGEQFAGHFVGYEVGSTGVGSG